MDGPWPGQFRALVHPLLKGVEECPGAESVWLPHRVDVRLQDGGRIHIGRPAQERRGEGGWRVCVTRGVDELPGGAALCLDDTDASPTALLQLLRVASGIPEAGQKSAQHGDG